MIKRAKYTEPDNYIPKDIRKELKLGEFAEEEKEEKKERDAMNKEFHNYDYVNGKKKK